MTRKTSNMDPKQNKEIVKTTHRDPEPPIDMGKKLDK